MKRVDFGVSSYQGLLNNPQNFVSVLSTGKVGFQLGGEVSMAEFSQLIQEMGQIVADHQAEISMEEANSRIEEVVAQAKEELIGAEIPDNVVNFNPANHAEE